MHSDLSSSTVELSGSAVHVERVTAEEIDGYVSVVVEGVRLEGPTGGAVGIRVAFGEAS